jgi:hypothetical protein
MKMKYLTIILLLIIYNKALKRKRTAQGECRINITRVFYLPGFSGTGKFIIREPVELLFEYNNSIIIIKEATKANDKKIDLPISLENPPRNLEKLPIAVDIDLCNFSTNNNNEVLTCYKLISQMEVHKYQLTYAPLPNNNDNIKKLEEIKAFIGLKRIALFSKAHPKGFTDEEKVKFEYIGKLFQSLSFYRSGSNDQYFEIIRKNPSTLKEVFLLADASDISEESSTKISKYFNEHVNELIKIINSPTFNIEKVKKVIFDKWSGVWMKTFKKEEYTNKIDYAVYACVLANFFDFEELSKERIRDQIFRFIFAIIHISPEEEELIEYRMKLVGSMNFPKNIKLKGGSVGLTNLTNIEELEVRYKTYLVNTITDLLESIREDAQKYLNILVKPVLL